ncbi:MAG: ABC transporter permease [Chloroflexi bacterium]|nr:ABC transporter permease [Chloroflexota bacterium]
MRPRLSSRQLSLIGFSLLIGLGVMFFITYKVFGGSWETMTDAPDYVSLIIVNALIGFCVVLFVVELRWDALRVILTVVFALLLGGLVTAVFFLDAANKYVQGEFKVQVVSDAQPLIDMGYGDRMTELFNNPNVAEPVKEVAYQFVGREGDEIAVLAYAEDRNAGLDMQVALLDAGGQVLAEASGATEDQIRSFRRYLKSETDAVIESFLLPADGTYSVVARMEDPASEAKGDATVVVVSEAGESPIDMAYNTAVGATFNAPNVSDPISEAAYRFAGSQGDVVSVLSYAARSNIAIDLEVALLGPDGAVLAESSGSTAEQVAQYRPDLSSERDAIIENFTLPADGIYTARTQPEPLTTSTRISETVSQTADAYQTFLLGPLSRQNRWVIWMRDALTLIMLGLAISIVFRAEQFSLGADGQLYFGALASGALVLAFGDLPKILLVPVALLAAATTGFLWGLVPGVLKAYLGANELVSTLMLNTVAARFYEMVITEQLQPPDAGFTTSDWFAENGLLTPIIDVAGDQVTIAVYLLIILVLLTWVLIKRTPLGYEIRMIGANIKFANFGGINSKRTIMLAMALSGAVAGLAGAHLAMGIHRRLILNISLGLGFEGVVVALLARNNPLVVPFTGLLYAYLRTGAQVMERDANVSSEVVRIIQAVVILLITADALVAFFRQRRITRRGTLDLDVGADPAGGLTASPQEAAHG